MSDDRNNRTRQLRRQLALWFLITGTILFCGGLAYLGYLLGYVLNPYLFGGELVYLPHAIAMTIAAWFVYDMVTIYLDAKAPPP